jgi:hypothetical protein
MDTSLSIMLAYPTIIYSTILGILTIIVSIGLLGIIELNLGFDIDFDIDSESANGLSGLLLNWGLTGPPITISLLILSFIAWIFSYLAVSVLNQFFDIGLIYYLISTIILIVSFYLSIPITAILVKPLAKLFRAGETRPAHTNLIGKLCKIRSIKANSSTGEATVINDGAELMIKVRCLDEELLRGNNAYIIKHNEENNSYRVVSEITFSSQM